MPISDYTPPLIMANEYLWSIKIKEYLLLQLGIFLIVMYYTIPQTSHIWMLPASYRNEKINNYNKSSF